jgi:thiol-disulfide isomerase/thioredoxin
MKRAIFWAGAAALLALIGTPAIGGELGDKAAPLTIGEWIKGGPVTIGPGDKVHVVEFWATWCPPCRASIPHLTELQAKYKEKGVVFVGVSNEDSATVKPFVQNMGAKMEYTVAVDKDEATSEGYMKAFGQNGIPTAFVIDKQGRVAWVGHPMDDHFEATIDGLLDGTYNIEEAKTEAKRQKELEKQAAEKMKEIQRVYSQLGEYFVAGNAEQAHALAEKILTDYSTEGQFLNEVAWVLLTYDDKKLHNYPLALRMAKAAMEASKGNDPAIIDTYARALFETGDVKGAAEYQQKAVDLETGAEMREDLTKALKRYQEAMTKTGA